MQGCFGERLAEPGGEGGAGGGVLGGVGWVVAEVFWDVGGNACVGGRTEAVDGRG